MRTGLIAKKVGMSRIFTDEGVHIPVTVLKVDGCHVVAQRTAESNGYDALQLGVGQAKVKNVSKAMRGHFANAKVEPRQKMAEFRISAENMVDVGSELSAAHFVDGQSVDVTGTSIGKGFQGGVKRHNFTMQDATHGNSISHRSNGSIGQCQTPGRVFKGKKMSGHMGAAKTTVQNLTIHSVDEARNLILVKGAVPGPKGSDVVITPAIKLKNKG